MNQVAESNVYLLAIKDYVKQRLELRPMRARVGNIPDAEDATWGAVFATLYAAHRDDWRFDWTGYLQHQSGAYSVMKIQAPGEDVAAMRAEIEEIIGFVDDIVQRDPLNRMVPVDMGLVEVLVD